MLEFHFLKCCLVPRHFEKIISFFFFNLIKLYFQGFIVVLLGFQLVRSFPLDEYYVNYERSPTGQSYVYRYQPEPSSYYRQLRSDINKPMYVPGLGMKPQYHNLVFDYVKSFGGTEPPTFVNAVSIIIIIIIDFFFITGRGREGNIYKNFL